MLLIAFKANWQHVFSHYHLTWKREQDVLTTPCWKREKTQTNYAFFIFDLLRCDMIMTRNSFEMRKKYAISHSVLK